MIRNVLVCGFVCMLVLGVPSSVAADERVEESEYHPLWVTVNEFVAILNGFDSISCTGPNCFDIHEGDTTVRITFEDELGNVVGAPISGLYQFRGPELDEDARFFCEDTGVLTVPEGATRILAVAGGLTMAIFGNGSCGPVGVPATQGLTVAHFNAQG